MRVIAGSFKGRKLTTVHDLSVRPATDRVKQTVFDMLTNRMQFEGARVLDLFAGSGSLGIEALSRGAEHVTFVENNEEAARCIEHNVRSLGCEDATDIHETDAMSFILTVRSAFDLIFADPPYLFGSTLQIPSLVFRHEVLRHDGLLLIEHASNMHFASTPEFHAGPEKKFGRTIVTFFRRGTHDHGEARDNS